MTTDLKKLGVSRLGDNAQALLVHFSREPSDDEMRMVDLALGMPVTNGLTGLVNKGWLDIAQEDAERARAEVIDLRAALRREQDARAQLRVELDRKQGEAAALAEVIGIDPREPSPQPLLVEVAYHVRNTMEGHRRLAHDVVRLTQELDQARAQHKADNEGFSTALATVEHEKELLEQEAIRLHSERDQARWQLAAAMRTIEAVAAALGGPYGRNVVEPVPGGVVRARAISCKDNGEGVCTSCSTVHTMPPASAFLTHVAPAAESIPDGRKARGFRRNPQPEDSLASAAARAADAANALKEQAEQLGELEEGDRG